MIARRTVLAGGAALAATPALAAEGAAAPVGRDLPDYKLTAFLRAGAGPQTLELRRLAGLGRIMVNVVDRARSPDAPYDSVIEMWFPSGPPPALPSFGAGSLVLSTMEVEIRRPPPGPAPKAKRMGLVRRRDDLDRAAFQETWRRDHAPLAEGGYGLRRYVLNLAKGGPPDWDGYAEMWWDSFADMEESSRRIAAAPSREPASPFGAVLMLRMTEDA
jgi:uncharacterized protein (TIGR02118 family)